MPPVAQHFADFFLLQLFRRFARPPRKLDIMRDKGVPWIARQQNDFCAPSFAGRNKIFPAQIIPAIGFRPLFEAVVLINDPRNARVAVLFGIERERMPVALAIIRAEKGAQPGAAALWNRNHDGVAAGKFPRPAAEVPTDHYCGLGADSATETSSENLPSLRNFS